MCKPWQGSFFLGISTWLSHPGCGGMRFAPKTARRRAHSFLKLKALTRSFALPSTSSFIHVTGIVADNKTPAQQQSLYGSATSIPTQRMCKHYIRTALEGMQSVKRAPQTLAAKNMCAAANRCTGVLTPRCCKLAGFQAMGSRLAAGKPRLASLPESTRHLLFECGRVPLQQILQHPILSLQLSEFSQMPH